MTAVTLLMTALLSTNSQYVLVFAYQDAPYGGIADPRACHSFAVWVETDGETIVDQFAISWICLGDVRIFRGAERGQNLSMDETLRRSDLEGASLMMWEPFRVTPEARDRAKKQFDRLEEGERTGSVLYKVLDRRTRFGSLPAINCIHVLTDLAAEGVRTGDLYGADASAMIVNLYATHGLISDTQESPAWIWKAIGSGRDVHQVKSTVALPDNP